MCGHLAGLPFPGDVAGGRGDWRESLARWENQLLGRRQGPRRVKVRVGGTVGAELDLAGTPPPPSSPQAPGIPQPCLSRRVPSAHLFPTGLDGPPTPTSARVVISRFVGPSPLRVCRVLVGGPPCLRRASKLALAHGSWLGASALYHVVCLGGLAAWRPAFPSKGDEPGEAGAATRFGITGEAPSNWGSIGPGSAEGQSERRVLSAQRPMGDGRAESRVESEFPGSLIKLCLKSSGFPASHLLRCASVSTEPDTGLRLVNHEITT